MINREDVARSMVKQAGGIYVGIQSALEPCNDLILFNDPVTETTIAVAVNIASVPVIKAKLLRSRMIFTEAEMAIAKVGRIKPDLYLEVQAIRNQTYLLLAYIKPDSVGLENLHQILARLDVLSEYLKQK